MADDMSTQERLATHGFALVSGVLIAAQIEHLQTALADMDTGPGLRDLALRVDAVRTLACSAAVRALVDPVLGPQAAVVRSIFFNKRADLNWQVAWHQDLTIAVREQASVEGFGPWSLKQGIVHVQPPLAVLERMLTVRIHLDDADADNGALWVVPGSHAGGRLAAADAAQAAHAACTHLCAAHAGDALLMRPLILHASRKSSSARPRRVLHLEFAADPLPVPLRWHEWIA